MSWSSFTTGEDSYCPAVMEEGVRAMSTRPRVIFGNMVGLEEKLFADHNLFGYHHNRPQTCPRCHMLKSSASALTNDRESKTANRSTVACSDPRLNYCCPFPLLTKDYAAMHLRATERTNLSQQIHVCQVAAPYVSHPCII